MVRTYGLVAVFAHPDDEGSMGGTLAKYAEMGVRVQLITATCGDGVDAKISDPSFATRETLCQERAEELRCACHTLGLPPPILLGYQDGELDQMSLRTAGADLAQRLYDLKPDVIVTHDPGGGYGHHDHIAVNRFVNIAWDLMSDPTYLPSKLYYIAFPRSLLDVIPGFRERRAEIRGQQLGFRGVPDEEITTAIAIAPYLERKEKALACHRTQFPVGPDGRIQSWFSQVEDALRQRYFHHERFVLARSAVGRPAQGQIEEDLFAGMEGEYTEAAAR
jgi:LmbE family N-acetylglucosaminyl deacetylase